MYLKSIRISNFRCFGQEGIEAIFNKGVNAIIGENNSGKSALIDGIRIAFSTVYYQKDIFFSKSDLHVDLSGDVSAISQFDVVLEDVPKHLIEIWDPMNQTQGEFHIKFFTTKTPNGIDKIKYSAWGGKIEGNTLSSETFDAIDIEYLGALRDAESDMKPSRTSKLAGLLGAIANTEASREELVDVLGEANKKLLKKHQIMQTRDVINNNLYNIEQEIMSQQIDIGFIEPKFESIASSMRAWIRSKWVYILNTNTISIEIKQVAAKINRNDLINDDSNGFYLNIFEYIDAIKSIENISEDLKNELNLLAQRTFELRQNGLGYNNLIYMSAVLGDMSINKKGIYHNLFLVEEPEAHLHPQLQELVHSFFQSEHNNTEKIQVIYTSHSPTLVSRIGIDNINLIFEKNYKIHCLPLSKTQLDNSDKVYLEKYLDVTKSQLFFAKGIIFVEGISEALILPEMAKLLNRPLDKYAVEIVNINGVAFKPFANLLTDTTGTNCFAKTSIITDDDICTDKSQSDTYISKDLDFDTDVSGIIQKLQKGTPSERFLSIQNLCEGKNISLCRANKTFEYEIAFCKENITLILNIIKDIYPRTGAQLVSKVNSLTTLEEKQASIWLFIRYRSDKKGEIAQALSIKIKEQLEDIKKGKEVQNPFKVPEYIKKAIANVTEEIMEETT